MLTPRSDDPNRKSELKRRELQPHTFGKKIDMPFIDLSAAFRARREEDQKELFKPTIGDEKC